MVPFEKYANAAKGLSLALHLARALAAGAPNIERVDKLVQSIAKNTGKSLQSINETVQLVDEWLEKNRAQ